MRERAIVSDAELAALRAELEGRRRGEGRRRFRQALWRLTVAGTYRVKRAGDFAAALAGLVVLSPVFVAVALAVKLTSRGPVFFAQTRVGRYGRHFRFYKFRSMHVDAEARKAALLARNESADGVIFKMKDDPRVTRVGRFLRRSSLDELPQLFNVLLGDMSWGRARPCRRRCARTRLRTASGSTRSPASPGPGRSRAAATSRSTARCSSTRTTSAATRSGTT